MSNADRNAPPLAVIVRWPNSIPAAPAPEQLLRRFRERRVASTWAIEQPNQALAIGLSQTDNAEVAIALLLAETSQAAISEAIDRRLEAFDAAGQVVVALQVAANLPRGEFERRLRRSGVRAIIGKDSAGGASVIRPLPFGIWEFGPHITAPARMRLPLFGRRRTLSQSLDHSPAAASIDLSRIGSLNSRAWRQVEQLVDQAAEANERGAARILTIGQFASELSSQTAARPQRSILRSAA